MMQWAASGRFTDIAFLCCCLDSCALTTALDFERNYFEGAPPSLLNAFIDNRADFPTFKTQLGCGGFVIFDAARNLKVAATKPWQQHREGAFRDVEDRLGFALRDVGSGGKLPEAATPQDERFDQEKVVVAVDAVGHAGIDAEHERCAVALRLLQDTLTISSLRSVRSELVSHFNHEEDLLREAGIGGDQASDASGLSAYGNHIKDHARIVGIADAALAKLDAACDRFEGSVPKAAVSELAKAFVEHATLYDALYAGIL